MTTLNQINDPTGGFKLSGNEKTVAEIVYTRDEILKNILNKCKIEAESEDLEIPITRFAERVSHYTGIPIDTVKNICNKEHYVCQKNYINLSSRIEVYKCLRDFYKSNTPPTYSNVYKMVKKLINVSSLPEFEHNMILMGYNYRSTALGIQILVEDPKITFERFFYLNKITQIRKKNERTVYYIDERVIDTRLTFQKPWIDIVDDTSASWNGYILLHVISGKKYVNNLYYNRVTEEDFKKWIYDIVLKKLNAHSVIVMDKNELHGTYHPKSITKYDKKEDMLKWLKENNVPCTSNMRKPELFHLYNKCPKSEKVYDIDRILKAHGHDVLRLPSTLHDLTPTEIFWDNIRSSIASDKDIITSTSSSDKLYKVKSKINSIVKSYQKETWIKFENEIALKENQLYELDAEVESVIDNFFKGNNI